MNKAAIKNYAVWARRKLIESAKQRAFEIEITDGGVNDPTQDTIAGHPLNPAKKAQRAQLIGEIRSRGYEAVMEEAAYTWFNRFIALRFMEVNGYLPSKVRVFTDENGEFHPEILKQALNVDLDGLDRERILALKDAADDESLYQYLLITQCNALNEALPYMFETISNWTELLFPSNLLRPDSVIGRMVSDIPEEDWTDAVQIIGWLYQYYNSELKDETYDLLKKNVKISKERLPSATQLFTPDWIVRYMVENSLGRIAVSSQLSAISNQQSAVSGQQSETERIEKEKEIAESFGWKYYLPEAEQTPEVREQLNSLAACHSSLATDSSPLAACHLPLAALKFLDPCMGSGHVLVYAFDVLMQLYTAEGWSERDAARSILENNLFGLDIDTRAGQLAYFAVMMKARKYSRRIFSAGIRPNIFAVQDSDFINNDLVRFVSGEDSKLQDTMWKLKETFRDAKEYGSLIQPNIPDFPALREKVQLIAETAPQDLIAAHFHEIVLEKLLPMIDQAEMLSQKYDVVCTNPPYMSSSQMSIVLSDFVKEAYPDSKGDLFSVFIERNLKMLNANGFSSQITMHSWMFLSSFESLRKKLIQGHTIMNMVHLGARGFDEIGGEVVQTTAFILRNLFIPSYDGIYCRMVDPKSESGKRDLFLSGENRYSANQENFSKIPGSPIAYWLSDALLNSYNNPPIISSARPCKGIDTGDNSIFLRLWHEINKSKISFPHTMPLSSEDIYSCDWFPYNKGGAYRKWYGNNEYMIYWKNNGKKIKAFSGSNLRNKDTYFTNGITWSTVTSGSLSMRYFGYGYLFDNGGSCLFANQNLTYYLGFLNSVVTKELMGLSPTLNSQPGDIGKLPIVIDDCKKQKVNEITQENINISISDWDSFETSWDFKKHPLI